MTENPSIRHFEWQNGLLFDDSAAAYPSRLHALVGDRMFDLNEGSTYFVYQFEGCCWIDSRYPLLKGHFACCTEQQDYLRGSADCQAIIIERIGTKGVFHLGGPIEPAGRLKYIDGCTDSLLIAPWKLGEPCLNHLHFPQHIEQTMHTHPSIRIGLVARGAGECVTPFGNIPLVPGRLFAILPENGSTAAGLDGEQHPEGSHCFRTFRDTMDVIAFHPDSDFGPTDEEHPMINRTIVNGTSARFLEEIRTK